MAPANIVKVVREDDKTSQMRDKSGALIKLSKTNGRTTLVRDILSLEEDVTRHAPGIMTFGLREHARNFAIWSQFRCW